MRLYISYNGGGEFRNKIDGLSTRYLICQTTAVGKLQLRASPRFFAYDAAESLHKNQITSDTTNLQQIRVSGVGAIHWLLAADRPIQVFLISDSAATNEIRCFTPCVAFCNCAAGRLNFCDYYFVLRSVQFAKKSSRLKFLPLFGNRFKF